MSTFKERIQLEQTELKDKLTKLEDFINNNPIFDTLGKVDKNLLIKQREIMQQYFQVLQLRLDRL